MYWVGARGSAKSDPFICLCRIIERIDAVEHKRKNYRKARWKRSHTRWFCRAAKDFLRLEVKAMERRKDGKQK